MSKGTIQADTTERQLHKLSLRVDSLEQQLRELRDRPCTRCVSDGVLTTGPDDMIYALQNGPRQLSAVVAKQVDATVNATVMPQVKSMAQWVNYHTQDTGEVITEYRHALDATYNGDDTKKSAITDGKERNGTGRWADGNIGLFFG